MFFCCSVFQLRTESVHSSPLVWLHTSIFAELSSTVTNFLKFLVRQFLFILSSCLLQFSEPNSCCLLPCHWLYNSTLSKDCRKEQRRRQNYSVPKIYFTRCWIYVAKSMSESPFNVVLSEGVSPGTVLRWWTQKYFHFNTKCNQRDETRHSDCLKPLSTVLIQSYIQISVSVFPQNLWFDHMLTPPVLFILD